jgi:hypothetical protein
VTPTDRRTAEHDDFPDLDFPAHLLALQAAYPARAVTTGQRTESAWVHAIMDQGGAPADVVATMRANLETQITGAQWAKDGGRFVPRLDRWLAEGLWLQRHEPEPDTRTPFQREMDQAQAAIAGRS